MPLPRLRSHRVVAAAAVGVLAVFNPAASAVADGGPTLVSPSSGSSTLFVWSFQSPDHSDDPSTPTITLCGPEAAGVEMASQSWTRQEGGVSGEFSVTFNDSYSADEVCTTIVR